jgi:hypothetical protein
MAFGQLALNEDDPGVRLAYASALQRLDLADRWALAAGLVGRSRR